MNNKFLLFLVAGIATLQASDQRELQSVISSGTSPSQTISRARPNLACWCKIPCWGLCESSYPESCLSSYNRNEEKAFRTLFPVGGPSERPGNPIKSCYVEYLRKTSSNNCTIATTVSATAFVATILGAMVGSCGGSMGHMCCGCPESNACSHFIVETCCPFACDLRQGVCCPPNTYNVLSVLAELGCVALPFGCCCVESCCLDYLATPENWDTQNEEGYDLL